MSQLLRKLLLLFALTATLAASPHDFEVDGIYYNILPSSDNAVYVTYRGEYYDSFLYEYIGSVVIPSSVEYNGKTYSVTSIGDSAFRDCKSLASVIIPNSVTSIGDYAFNVCSSLATVEISNSVTSIGDSAFAGCRFLASVVIPNSVTSIGEEAFSGCGGLKKSAYPSSIENPFTSFTYCVAIAYPADGHIDEAGVIYDKDITNLYYAPITLSESYIIPNTVTSIGKEAFSNCSSLASVEIPNSVTSIGEEAFYYCSSLASVVIPNSVTSIGDLAFSNCPSLASVVIPNSVTSISYGAFAGCYSLASVVIPNSVTSIGDLAFYGCYSLASVEIPSSVTSIGDRAFYECSSLASVVIPNSVTSIGDRAFYECSSLASVVIPNSVTSIGDRAFYECSSLASVVIPNSVTSIGDLAFSNCPSLASVVIPNSVTSISYGAFAGCSSLASVVIPNSVTAIGNYAFYGCTSLVSVVIPNSVTSIERDAFYGCRGIKKSAYPSSISNPFNSGGVAIAYPADGHIDEAGVIYDKDITKVYYAPMTLSEGYRIPNTVTSIGEEAFYYCSSLASVEIPNSVTSIGDKAFRDCSSLASVEIPNSVTSIGNRAFYYCSSLASVEIPNSVTFIGNEAFYGSRLKSVTFGTGLISIEKDAFKDNNIAKAFWLGNTPPSGYEQVNAYINYVPNDQYNLDNQIKYQFLSSKFTVDGTVYVPVSPSERTCDVVDCLYNPAYSTPVISDKVTNKGIEMTVKRIRQYAFYNNSDIESLALSNIGFVGSSAFYGCTSLQTATIKNDGNIGNSAFYGCTALQTATIENKGDIGESAFYNDKALKQVQLGNEVTGISENAFYGCSALPEVAIPNSVTTLGASAFEGCSALKSATLGTGFDTLPSKVFSGCSSLESISIPNNVSFIADYAFEGCSSLADISIEDDDEKEPEPELEPEGQTNILYPDWTSSNHADNSESHQEYLLYAKAGAVLTFNYSVDSESGYDFFIAKINGSEVIKASGKKSDSFRYQFSEAGQMTLYLSYTKDSSGNSGQDRVVVSDIWLKGAYIGPTDHYISLASNGSSPLFADCPLDEVYIGRKLSYKTDSNYGYSPFYRNTSLRTVEIADAETEIYDNEFYGCSGLKSLKVGNGVKKIGKWAFSGCSSLDYFSAGYNVESIGDEAFYDCTGLTKYYSHSIVPPVCGYQALYDINKWECSLYVPAESSDEYKAAPQWKDFFFIEEMSVLVAAIELNTTEAELIAGSTLQLSATILPANATNQALVWESSDVSVAEVDNNGLVSGLKEGAATITARSADGNAEATCLVTVKEITGIDTANSPAAYALIKTSNGYVVRNARGARVEVYSADGRMVYLAPTYAEEEIALPAGLYIVSAANRAWKVRF